MERRAIGEEAGTTGTLRDVIVLVVAQRFDFIGAGLNRGGLDVGPGIGMMRLNQSDVIKKKLVAAAMPNWPFLKSTRISGAVRL